MRVTETEPNIHARIAIATWDWPRPGVPSRVSIGHVLGNDNSYLIAQLKIMDGNSGSMIVNANQEICGLANGVGEGPVAGKAFFHSMKEIMRQVKEQSPETYAEITEATNASPSRCVASLPANPRRTDSWASRVANLWSSCKRPGYLTKTGNDCTSGRGPCFCGGPHGDVR